MLDSHPNATPASLREASRAAGFRRVERVHITTGGGRAVAEVTGVIHRHPRTVGVPLATARALVAAGAPVVVRRGEPGRSGS